MPSSLCERARTPLFSRHELCRAKCIARGYVVTKSLDDFGPMPGLTVSASEAAAEAATGTTVVAKPITRVPAPLLGYWMGATEPSVDQQPGEGAAARSSILM